MRKTKIIATIGPASESEEMIRKLALAGMNVARLNFSHGTYDQHRTKIERIKKVREELDLPIALMLDTKWPEYRIGSFKNGKVHLNEGDVFSFTSETIDGDETRVSVNYSDLPKELSIGDKILLNNGLMSFEVTDVSGNDIITTVVVGGELSNKKSMSFPGKVLKQVYLSEQDKSDLLFGIEQGVDFVACSFVSVKQDILDIRNFLDENGGEKIELIAKIENQSGCDNIEEICDVCNGVMVARGDMGVEISLEKLPAIQKELITKCRMLGKRVITATEMLESMIHNPRPTRAEASDVANAVYDGTSAVMLSGETAAGAYPEESVRMMSSICQSTEENINYKRRFHEHAFLIQDEVDAISHSTCSMAIDLNARTIVASSLSGTTARMVSRFRPPMDIIGLTTSEETRRKLALSWGVIPVSAELYPSTDVLFFAAKKTAQSIFKLNKGDKIVITGGVTTGAPGNTSLIKIETL
ncbi:MAG: pyruvate kinase [Lachnospiraceae bacterium]|nr:pyruvate kinase [Lachnospiraceae bacterium]